MINATNCLREPFYPTGTKMTQIKKVIVIGQRFGRLIVLEKGKSVPGGKTVKRLWGTWKCQCDCGNIISVKTTHLNKGQVKSCGCLLTEYGRTLKPGQKFNRLTTVSYKEGRWVCICECGNTTNSISTHSLISGNTKSCGCWNEEVQSQKAYKLIEGRRQYEPQIASARRVWKRYCWRDNQCLDFDNFLKISQQNCFYCGIKPSTQFNNFDHTNGSIKSIKEGLFIYNGMDRIDSGKHHTTDNVLPCCTLCNRSKSNCSIEDFLYRVNNLQVKDFIPIIMTEIDIPIDGSLLTSLNCVFENYQDGYLTIEEYYTLSQMNCFYCNIPPSNIFNKAKTDKKASLKAKENGKYIYNGLDRVNSNLPHSKDNVVPCCKYCNWSKGNLTLEDFHSWIKRIQAYQASKK